MLRVLALLTFVATLAACNGASDLDKAPTPLGDFNLHHNIVVAPKAQKGPLSREVSKEQLAEAGPTPSENPTNISRRVS